MDSPIRVLVVDDSAFTRKVVSDMLAQDPGITVVGVARDGRAAIEKVRSLHPDVVTLDVEMPVLDGLAALRTIMDELPTPVVMLSALTQEGAATTIQALELGAVDFVPKPSPSMTAGLGGIRDLLVGKVKLAAQAKVHPLRAGRTGKRRAGGNLRCHGLGQTSESALLSCSAVADAPRRKVAHGDEPDVTVVIGASTGGPSALNQVLPALPGDIRAAILVVQHMPPGFTKSLAARLDDVSSIQVKEAEQGDRLTDGRALVAPGGHHMTLTDDGGVSLSADPPRNGVRPSVDTTMESAARVFGDRVVGVVLTGMGRDGAAGMAAIKAAGGRTIAEHESTCVIYGMPRAVIDQGVADIVVPLFDVADAITDAVQQLK